MNKDYTCNMLIAKNVGMVAGFLFNYFAFWVEKNEQDDRNEWHNEYWTYNSMRVIHETCYPMFSYNTVAEAIRDLEKQGYIKSGNFNKVAYDKTKWYTLTEKGWEIRRHSVKTEKSCFYEDAEDVPKVVEKEKSQLPTKYLESLARVLELKTPEGDPLFRNKLRLPYTKGVEQVYRYLQMIYSGKFLRSCELSDVWLEQNKFHKTITEDSFSKVQAVAGNWDKVYALFEEACQNFATWYKPDRSPFNKEFLKKLTALENFMYSWFTKQSYFLCCVLGAAVPLENKVVDSIANSVSDPAYKAGTQLFREHFDKVTFWKKIKSLDQWYDEFRDGLVAENKNALYWLGSSDKGKERWFQGYVDNLISFTNGAWSINQVGTKNKTWQAWLDICEKEYRITI